MEGVAGALEPIIFKASQFPLNDSHGMMAFRIFRVGAPMALKSMQ